MNTTVSRHRKFTSSFISSEQKAPLFSQHFSREKRHLLSASSSQMSIPVSEGMGIIWGLNYLSSIAQESLDITSCDDVRTDFSSETSDAIFSSWFTKLFFNTHPN